MSEPKQTCPSCGAASPADAQFCRDCGAILVRTGDAARSPSLPPGSFDDPGPAVGAPPPEDKGKRTAALVIAAVIILGIALFFYEKRGDSQIPVPGESPTEVVPTVVVATEPPEPRRQPTLPPAPPPRAREPEPELGRRPERPVDEPPPREREREPRPEPEREVPAVESGRQLRPGWYRVRFRAPLFQSPSETAPIVTYLKPGTRIRVTEVVPGFLAVESTTGKAPGYVSTDDAAPEQRSD